MFYTLKLIENEYILTRKMSFRVAKELKVIYYSYHTK